MIIFNIVNMNTGRLNGTVNGKNYTDAENKCLAKGIDMYDEYMLVDSNETIEPASIYIDEILER